MGITGLLPFVSGASRKAHVSEWSGCSVAIDAYCWLHRGAFACADRLARGDATDLHIKYCMKYVSMLLARNIKPVLVFDGRHLPAKAGTEAKRRESRDIAKKRAAELLRLGQIEEARTYMRRSVDITHEMALQLMRECRARRVDCMVAPYEADAQLAYLNMKNIVQLVITEDSDLILFGCTKVLFKMDLEGSGILVDTTRLPLVMKCPIERYSFDKFRRMCIMSGCDYLSSLPGIGLAKARQFVTSTQDPDFANALKKLPSFFNKSQLVVSDDYRESFLKAEATFKHQYVFDPLTRTMVRLLDPYDEGTELELCSEAGKLLEPDVAFQLALGNLDPFTLRKMDDWHPDRPSSTDQKQHSQGWKDTGVSKHPSVWERGFARHTSEETPWRKKIVKKEEPILQVTTRPRRNAVLVVPETQDESLTIESLKNMYRVEPDNKRQKLGEETNPSNTSAESKNGFTEPSLRSNNTNGTEPDMTSSQEKTSPILVNKNRRCFKKAMTKSSYSIFKRLSKFPRTTLEGNVVESKFFSVQTSVTETRTVEVKETSSDSQKENSPIKNGEGESSILDRRSPILGRRSPTLDRISPTLDRKSPILDRNSPTLDRRSPILNRRSPTLDRKSPILEMKMSVSRNPFKVKPERVSSRPLEEIPLSEDSVIESTYPMETLITPVDSQSSFGEPFKVSLHEFKRSSEPSRTCLSQPTRGAAVTAAPRRSACKVPGLTKRNSAPILPSNQPTLLSKFGFQKKAVLKR